MWRIHPEYLPAIQDCIATASASFSREPSRNWRHLLPRLFVSHSSKDNVQALAFQRWLMASGWGEEDVFIDLHGIGAGERWRETLQKANASCEAVLLLASPEALDSPECQRELNLAEDLGKEIIVAILRDLGKDDPRLARWADRQFVDLSAQPTERMEPFEHDGRVQRVEFNPAALASIKARLAHLGIAPDSFAWTPHGKESGPYPGLAAFDEADAGIFFGRDADIMAGLTDLRLMRRRHSPRWLAIVAASGAGKSSFLRAGLWPRLKRDPDFAPLAILRPAQGILTGPDGLGRKLARWFDRHGRRKLPGDIHAAMARSDPEAAAALGQLLAEAGGVATTARRARAQDARAPAPLLAIDQGEELFAAENATESERLLRLLAAVLRDPPDDVDPYVLVTIRADSVEALLQRWPALGLATPQSCYLTPLSRTAYREVIVRPAEVYSQRVRGLAIEPALVDALVRDAEGADALPLLAFTLERLFTEFGADGQLTLARYEAMGGIGGSIDRALAEAQRKAGAGGGLEALRRLLVPGLATWDPGARAAKRRVAREVDLIGGGRAELAPLAEALVEARLLTRGRDTIEVTHEALLHRAPISRWLEQLKDALKLRDDVLHEAIDWEMGGRKPENLVRRGERLAMVRDLLEQPEFASALAPAREFITACRKQEVMEKRSVKLVLGKIMTQVVGMVPRATPASSLVSEPASLATLLARRAEAGIERFYIPEERSRPADASNSVGSRVRDMSAPERISQREVRLSLVRMSSPDVSLNAPRRSATSAVIRWLLLATSAALLGVFLYRRELGALVAPLVRLFDSMAPPTAAADIPASPTGFSAADNVELAAFGPPRCGPGDTILVQALLHLSADQAVAYELADAADPGTTRKAIQTLSIAVKNGEYIEVALEADGCEIDMPCQTTVWRGAPIAVQYFVTVPDDRKKPVPVRMTAMRAGIPVGSIRFLIPIQAGAEKQPIELRGDEAKRFARAFLSYASEDRVPVLGFAQVLNLAGIEIFQDVLSLEPGDRWEQQLYHEIDRSDLFVLFWSKAASRSKWVLAEAEYALRFSSQNNSQSPVIRPFLLEGPPIPKIPASLKAIHFNDKFRYMILGAKAEARQNSPPPN